MEARDMGPRFILCVIVLVGFVSNAGFCSDFDEREIEGWTVRIDERLLEDENELGEKAIKLLTVKLFEINRVVPEPVLEKLHEVPIWLNVEDVHGKHKGGVYHPSKDWLVKNGYDPDMAGCVELANARNFLKWTRHQPWMVLHELAHAYHHQVIGHDNAELNAAYDHAVEKGNYESVLRYNGKKQKAYAINNVKEYFAEATEAFFGTNDFYPFVRPELKKHDPKLYGALEKLWRTKDE